MSKSDTELVLLERLKQRRFSRETKTFRSRSAQVIHSHYSNPPECPVRSSFLHLRRPSSKETHSVDYVARVKSAMEKKRAKTSKDNDVDSSIFIFNPPDWKWQKNKSSELDLPIERILWSRQAPWHLFTVDTPPKECEAVSGDGNCLFRALSFWITGSEDYHSNVRNAIVHEFVKNAPTYKGLISDTSVHDYLTESNMEQEGVWGTEVEIFVAASLLKTPVMVHAAYGERHLWQKFKPFKVHPPTAEQLRRFIGKCRRNNYSPLHTESTATIYLHNSSNHFEPVINV